MKVSDVVLMDLRNFVAANQGCVYELQTLATAPGLQRIVVLTNEHTDMSAAMAATAHAPSAIFVWVAQQGTPGAGDRECSTPLVRHRVIEGSRPPVAVMKKLFRRQAGPERDAG